LAGFCAASGIAECTVIAAGVEQYLDGTSDSTLVLRRLDRLGRAIARMHRDQELLAEAFSSFIQLWFAHMPSVADEDKPEARATAESRYKHFVEHVVEQFSGGRRFLDDLPRETVAKDDELTALAERTVGSGQTDPHFLRPNSASGRLVNRSAWETKPAANRPIRTSSLSARVALSCQ
jgi:hypothetical protein